LFNDSPVATSAPVSFSVATIQKLRAQTFTPGRQQFARLGDFTAKNQRLMLPVQPPAISTIGAEFFLKINA
jgi:hypothetical protein